MSRLKRLDPMKVRGIQTAPTPLEKAKRKANPTGREADPRRAIPLNSTRWRRLRKCILGQEPICRMCEREPATEVDHISGDPSDNSRCNLQGLCRPCHSHKTGRERHGMTAVHGHDAKGWPLDPAHPWNAPKPASPRRKPWEFTGDEDEKSLEGEAEKTDAPPSLYPNGRG